MKIKRLMKIIGIILLIVLVTFIFINRYYTMATVRECGYNPINHLQFFAQECWCENGGYGGFGCGNYCLHFCSSIDSVPWGEI